MIEFHTNSLIMEEARRLQSEAVARYIGKAWKWVRTALRSHIATHGVAVR